MSPELFQEYSKNPWAADEKVRNTLKLSENRYYSVSVWPVEGQVRETNQVRVKKAKKVSKSDQQSP